MPSRTQNLIHVRGLADALQGVATNARSDAACVEYAKDHAIARAEAAGFEVGDNLELTGRDAFPPGPARTANSDMRANLPTTFAAALMPCAPRLFASQETPAQTWAELHQSRLPAVVSE
jgi:hypothetical protein